MQLHSHLRLHFTFQKLFKSTLESHLRLNLRFGSTIWFNSRTRENRNDFAITGEEVSGVACATPVGTSINGTYVLQAKRFTLHTHIIANTFANANTTDWSVCCHLGKWNECHCSKLLMVYMWRGIIHWRRLHIHSVHQCSTASHSWNAMLNGAGSKLLVPSTICNACRGWQHSFAMLNPLRKS